MAAGQGPIYDTSITFPTNKADGGVVSDPTHFTATECNAQGAFNYATRTAITGGVFGGVVDQSASLPPLSSAGNVTWTSNGGQLAVSENAGPYIWIKSVDYVNLGDKRFGLVGGGTADDTAALVAASAASFATLGNVSKVLRIPEGVFRITSPVTLGNGQLGPLIEGNGVWDSCFLLDPATPNGDGLIINSCAQSVLSGFAINPKSANPTGKALSFNYSPVGAASSGHSLSDIRIQNNDGGFGFGIGIHWSDLYGNNSEVLYENVSMVGYTLCAVALPGSQQYGHTFYRCTLNGNWAAVTPGVNGGQYGIWAGPGAGTPSWAVSTAYNAGVVVVANGNFYTCITSGTSASSGAGPTGTGSNITDNGAHWAYLRASAQGTGCFSIRDSSVTNHSLGDFRVDGTNQQPILIDNIDSENSRATFIQGAGAPVGIELNSNVTIINSRLAFGATFDPLGVINYGFGGNLTVRDNFFYSPSGVPRIRLAPATAPRASIRDNTFNSPGSVNTDPIYIDNTSVNYRSAVDCRNNVFTDNAGLTAFRDEEINIIAPAAALTPVGNLGVAIVGTRAERLFAIDLTQFNAAALTQTITLVASMPKGLTYLDSRVLLYQYPTFSGTGPLSVKVGTSSGGDELLQSTTVGGTLDNTTWLGESSAQRGSAMLSSGGHMPSGSAASSIYVTLTSASGNLGNGTVSNLTRGTLHLALEYKLQPRFIA